MNKRQRFRELLKGSEIIVAPGAYDGATATLVEGAGFPAVYMSGAGVSSTFGLPDYGLLTMTEMVDRAGRMALCVGVPTIADADTGYGNELNVTRTVREYESRGVAAIHIEDQVSPKRCGHLAGTEVVSREDYLAKIRAAVAARQDPDFVIIARTDARGIMGMNEAAWRANAALDAGADMVFLEATRSVEEAASVPKLVHGPCLLNMVIGGRTPVLDVKQAERMGYRMAILPGLLFGSMVSGAIRNLGELKATGVHPDVLGDSTIEEVYARLGAKQWDELRTRFSQQPETPAQG